VALLRILQWSSFEVAQLKSRGISNWASWEWKLYSWTWKSHSSRFTNALISFSSKFIYLQSSNYRECFISNKYHSVLLKANVSLQVFLSWSPETIWIRKRTIMKRGKAIDLTSNQIHSLGNISGSAIHMLEMSINNIPRYKYRVGHSK
jgi:hypothetical protein